MSTQNVTANLVPLTLTYTPDSKLSEGRIIIPLVLSFAPNNMLDASGLFLTSTVTVQTANVKSVRVLSSIKSICVRFNTFNNQLLRIACAETGQSWVLGVPAPVPPGTSNFIINARLPFFLPQNATLNFTNFSLATDPPTNNNAQVQLCNFEVDYATSIVQNPFLNTI